MDAENIKFIESGDPNKPVMLGHRVNIRVLKSFLHYLGPDADYFTVTNTDYKDFVFNHYHPNNYPSATSYSLSKESTLKPVAHDLQRVSVCKYQPNVDLKKESVSSYMLSLIHISEPTRPY